MNKKIKKFWEDHKLAICLVGGTVAITTGLYLHLNSNTRKAVAELKGKSVLFWEPNKDPNKILTLERVKEILDLNKDNLSQFAIFREGSNPMEYIVIVTKDLGYKEQ